MLVGHLERGGHPRLLRVRVPGGSAFTEVTLLSGGDVVVHVWSRLSDPGTPNADEPSGLATAMACRPSFKPQPEHTEHLSGGVPRNDRRPRRARLLIVKPFSVEAFQKELSRVL